MWLEFQWTVSFPGGTDELDSSWPRVKPMGTALPKIPKKEKTNKHSRITMSDFKKLLNFMCMYVYHVYAEALRHQKIVVSHMYVLRKLWVPCKTRRCS